MDMRIQILYKDTIFIQQFTIKHRIGEELFHRNKTQVADTWLSNVGVILIINEAAGLAINNLIQ